MHEAEQYAEYDLLMESQFWSPNRIRELQHQRLELLLRHAREHVPFYATRLDPMFRTDGSINWDRWSDVPILKRSELAEHRRSMLARMLPEGHGHITDFATSGSTGLPVTTSHTSLALTLSEAAVFRGTTQHELDYSKPLGSWTGSDRKAAWPDGYVKERWGPHWDPTATAGMFEINREVTLANAVEFMKRNKVRYLTGGSIVRLMAYEVQRRGQELSLDAVLTRSAVVTDSDRAMMLEVFGARCIDLYASKEGHRMAHSCASAKHWHVNDEQVLLEILDSDDQPCMAGERGRVVITPFNSFAQPLIRYDHGDLAVRGAPCSQGHGLTVIDAIEGRIRHLFKMPDGERVFVWLAPDDISALNASMFQVAQVAPDLVEVRYLPKNSRQGADHDRVRSTLNALLHPQVKVEFRQVEEFALPAGGKHLEFVSELPDE